MNHSECIEYCGKCIKICTETLAYCLRKGGRHSEEKHIQSLLSCIEACKLCADYLLRDVNLHHEACRLCAKACEECFEACKAIDENDEQINQCMMACKHCMKSCQSMSK